MKPSKKLPEKQTFADTIGQKGYNVLYRSGQVNHCPGCGGTQWYVGRTTAECAYKNCGLAIEVYDRAIAGSGAIHSQNLHIPEKRMRTGPGVIYRKDFHKPAIRMMSDLRYVDA